jgi:hypothetical protein
MDKELFIDGFGNIMVTGTMVRIDLVSLVEPAAEGKQPRFEHRERLVMPLDGFLRSFGMAESVVQKMVDAGVVAKRKPGDEGTKAQVVETAPVSPNFG